MVVESLLSNWYLLKWEFINSCQIDCYSRVNMSCLLNVIHWRGINKVQECIFLSSFPGRRRIAPGGSKSHWGSPCAAGCHLEPSSSSTSGSRFHRPSSPRAGRCWAAPKSRRRLAHADPIARASRIRQTGTEDLILKTVGWVICGTSFYSTT